MNKKIAVLPGDGIGPEIILQAVRVLKCIAQKFHHEFEFNYGLIGACAIDKTGVPYPVETHNLCLASDAILFGAIGDPKYDNDPSAKVRPEQGLLKMRKELGLFANIRPVEIYPSLMYRSPLKEEKIKDVNLVVVRELTGGIYFGEKGRSEDKLSAYDNCAYSVSEISRIAHVAFKIALGRKRHLTLVDKANVLETSRLWRETVSDIYSSYPEVDLDFLFVDNAAMQLVTNPSKFDVILTENMFGDILSDEASVLSGSIGLLPSGSFGEKSPLFEPIHGSYPQAAGKNIANPLAAILSAAMLLHDAFGAIKEAEIIKEACKSIIESGNLTEDLSDKKISCTTSETGDKIIEYILSR